MIAPDIGRTRDFPNERRIWLYDRLRKIPCAGKRQARACAIHETFGFRDAAEARRRRGTGHEVTWGNVQGIECSTHCRSGDWSHNRKNPKRDVV